VTYLDSPARQLECGCRPRMDCDDLIRRRKPTDCFGCRAPIFPGERCVREFYIVRNRNIPRFWCRVCAHRQGLVVDETHTPRLTHILHFGGVA
jgi:hypothetical protein